MSTTYQKDYVKFSAQYYLRLDGIAIDQVTSAKSLGVYIDENLSWKTQIDHLSKTIASGIKALNRIRSFVPPVTLHYTLSLSLSSATL